MKTKFLLLLLAIAAMVFVGCVKTPDPQPAPDPVPIVDLKLSEVRVMASAIKLKVEPSDAKQPYLTLCVGKSMALNKSDKVLIGELLEGLKKQAATQSMDFKAFIASVSNTGVKEISIPNLAPATEYTIVAFGVNGITPGAVASRHNFKTLSADKIDCTFAVEVTVSANNAKYDIKPSNKETDWYFCTMPKVQFDDVTDKSKWDVNQMLIEYFAVEVAQLQANGKTQEEILGLLLHKGDVGLQAKGLNAEQEYVYLVGAIARTATGLVLVSDVVKDVYTVGKAPVSDMTFKITVDNIRKTKAHVKVEPSKLDESYIWLCSNYTAENRDMTPTEIMNSYYKGLDRLVGMVVTKGAKDYPDQGLAAGVDYYVMAFGFSGGPTTEPEIVKFSTPAGQNPADATIDVKVDSKNPFGAALTFTPSDESVYYTFGLVKTGTIEKDSIIKYFELGLINNLKMQQSMFKSTTMLDVVMLNCFHDVTPSYNFNDMEPNTVYDAFTLTTTLDGKVAAFKAHPAILKTSAVSAATVTAEVLGYFDGDQEAGTIFNQPNATAGKSIIVFKYTPSSADVTDIFSAVAKDSPDIDEKDSTVVSDKDLRDQLNWNKIKVESPYEFVLAGWGSALWSFAYAGVSDGGYGNIARLPIAAPDKTKVGTIAELKAIYDAANADSKDKAKAVKSMSEIARPEKRMDTPSVIFKKDVSSILNRYVLDTNADKTKVVVPYSLGASIELPLARIAR